MYLFEWRVPYAVSEWREVTGLQRHTPRGAVRSARRAGADRYNERRGTRVGGISSATHTRVPRLEQYGIASAPAVRDEPCGVSCAVCAVRLRGLRCSACADPGPAPGRPAHGTTVMVAETREGVGTGKWKCVGIWNGGS